MESITLRDWNLHIPRGTSFGYDGENNVYVIEIDTDSDAEWTYYLDMEYSDCIKGVLPLEYNDGVLTVTVGAAYMKCGYVSVQIRAIQGDKVKKSNISTVIIKRSINATEELTVTPVEWEVYEKQIAAIRDEAQKMAKNASVSAEVAETAKETAVASAESAKTSETVAENEAAKSEASAQRAAQAVGQVQWAYFKVDTNGRLQMHRADNYKEPSFTITSDGRMEVVYGNN